MPSFLPRMPSMTGPLSLLPEGLDLDVDAGRQLELHQRVDRLAGRLEDVQQPLVGPDLELLARLLVDVRRTVHGVARDVGRQRDRADHPRAGAPGGVQDLVRRRVQDPVVERLQADADLLVDHGTLLPHLLQGSCYLTISVTVPAPTVRPPSRMAKRTPFSIAIGAISSTSRFTLSPGITISVPSGRVATPVTSVVRK